MTHVPRAPIHVTNNHAPNHGLNTYATPNILEIFQIGTSANTSVDNGNGIKPLAY